MTSVSSVKTEAVLDPETGDVSLTARPARQPRRVYTSEELERIRGSILGEWVDQNNDDIYTITARDDMAGNIRPPRSWYDEEIRKVKERLRQTKKCQGICLGRPGKR